MYGDIVYENICERMRLAEASRTAAEGWRFRYHKSWESRMLSAVWGSVKEFVCKAVRIKEPSVAPDSYAGQAYLRSQEQRS